MTPKVLIADDEGHTRLLIKSMLKKIGWEVVFEAENGQQAIDQYKQLNPDIVLLDVNMPKKTGITALKEICEFDPQACIIMLTSISDSDSVKNCIEIGAENFILKSTSFAKIKNILIHTWEDIHNNE